MNRLQDYGFARGRGMDQWDPMPLGPFEQRRRLQDSVLNQTRDAGLWHRKPAAVAAIKRLAVYARRYPHLIRSEQCD